MSRKIPKTACVGWPAGPGHLGNRMEDLEDQGEGIQDVEGGSVRHRGSSGEVRAVERSIVEPGRI